MLTSRRGRRLAIRLLALFAFVLPLLVSPYGMALATSPFPDPPKLTATAQTATLAFVPNRGQNAAGMRFQADIAGGMATVFDDGIQLTLATTQPSGDADPHARSLPSGRPSQLRMHFVGAEVNPTLTPQHQLAEVFNDYTGDDRSRWRSNLPTYAGLRVTELYPKIMLDYSGDAGNLKSTYTIAPGGDPGRIRWRYTGAQSIHLASTGDLVLTLPSIGVQSNRIVTETAPIAWQEVGTGRVDVGVRFNLDKAGTIGFVLDSYDLALPLVIDPTLTTTGLANMTGAYGVDRDSTGNLYVTGCSTAGARLSRLTASGIAISTTAFGYDSTSCGVDVAVAPNGRILVAGTDQDYAETSTRAFVASWASPTATPVLTQLALGTQAATVEALSVTFSPNQQGYVLWRDSSNAPAQSLIAAISNGVPGSGVALGSDLIYGLAVDGAETIYTTRYTPSGSLLVKATLAGISSLVSIPAFGWVGLDAANNVYVVGTSETPSTSQIVVQSQTPAGQTRYTWASAVVGGDSRLYDADLDPDGGLVLVGKTNADDFPRVGGVGLPRTNERYSGFLLQLTPNGTGIAYSDLVNATTAWNRGTELTSITIDATGNAAIAGSVIDESNEWVSGLLTRVQIRDLPTPPQHTRSYYIQTNDLQLAMQSGCDARKNGEQGMLVLAFGRPGASGAAGEPRVRLVGKRALYISLADVENIVVAFAIGYAVPTGTWRGYSCTNASTNGHPASLQIIAGVSNAAVNPDGNIWQDNQDLNALTGKEWSKMVNAIDDKLRRPIVVSGTTIRIDSKVSIAAGYDAESYQSLDNRATQRIPEPGEDGAWKWTTYPNTLAWLNGYNSHQLEITRFKPVYIFGSCESCPRTGTPAEWDLNIPEVLRRVLEINYDIRTAFPLPQIYKAPYTHEWYNVRWYAKQKGKSGFEFVRIMTECDDSACTLPPYPSERLSPGFDCPSVGAPCSGDWQYFACTVSLCRDFTPQAGWQALGDLLRDPSYGAASFYRTPPLFVTDICQQVVSCDQGQQ